MQKIFKRYEKKYLVTQEQVAAFQDVFQPRTEPDQYGEYLVQNLYYDTESWDIMRASVESPCYKEKMRLRCYGLIDRETIFFLELKKKYKGIVYKRRTAIPAKELYDRTVRDIVSEETSQISRELDFYLLSNAVSERIYISYQRTAFTGTENKNLRITFDTDIRYRINALDFSSRDGEHSLLAPDIMLMEIKTPDIIPLWLARALSEHGIFPTPFSKAGICYTRHISGQPANTNTNTNTEKKVLINA
jgi:hypothetical protein